MAFDPSRTAVEPLSVHHDRDDFSCGNASLDHYIRKQAGQDSRRDLTRVWVAVDTERPTRIIGFFTLSATSVSRDDFPEDVGRRLPKYPIPAVLIGRFAVDLEYARKGLGRALLGRAISLVLGVIRTLAVAVVVVDPIDQTATAFYERFGFKALHSAGGRMFLTVSSQRVARTDVLS